MGFSSLQLTTQFTIHPFIFHPPKCCCVSSSLCPCGFVLFFFFILYCSFTGILARDKTNHMHLIYQESLPSSSETGFRDYFILELLSKIESSFSVLSSELLIMLLSVYLTHCTSIYLVIALRDCKFPGSVPVSDFFLSPSNTGCLANVN